MMMSVNPLLEMIDKKIEQLKMEIDWWKQNKQHYINGEANYMANLKKARVKG